MLGVILEYVMVISLEVVLEVRKNYHGIASKTHLPAF